MTVLASLLALVVLASILLDLDRVDGKAEAARPVYWHLWAMSRLVVAVSMVGRIALGFSPSRLGEQQVVVLTLAGMALWAAAAKWRKGE